MDRTEFQRVLGEEESPQQEALPKQFGADVLRRGRHLRQLVRRHWRWLRLASLIALFLAITIAVSLPRFTSQETRPPLRLFQDGGTSNPFSTR